MSTALSYVGKQLLNRLLPKEDAGACTVCPGPCSPAYAYFCQSGVLYRAYCQHTYTCDCGCVPTSCGPATRVGTC
jgi:hypothetical protein